MQAIPKIVAGVTHFSEQDINPILFEIDNDLSYLESKITDQLENKQSIILEDALVEDTVADNKVVTFSGTKWELINGLNPLGETLQKFPMGIAKSVYGPTGNKKATIYCFGYVPNITSYIIEDGSAPVVGVPYFLSPSVSGRITATQPAASVYIGEFLSNNVFLLNIQCMTTSHVHRRLVLSPTLWENHTTYLLYPASALGQLPLPFNGVVLVLDGKYMPYYGPYEVSTEGLIISDISYFETLLGIGGGTLFTTIANASYITEMFWSDPRTLTIPGVGNLESGTSNLTIENKVPGQPETNGSLVIKNIPTLTDKVGSTNGYTVIKNIMADTSGNLVLHKGLVVERLEAGENITLSSEQGTVRVSSAVSKAFEVEFSDIFLKGALSKIYPNTINTYTEYLYQRTNSAIYKWAMPYNVDLSKDIELYLTYFTLKDLAGNIKINIRTSIISRYGLVANTAQYSEVSLPVSVYLQPQRILLKSIGYNNLKSNAIIYIQLEREEDTLYAGNLGVLALTVKGYLA